MTTTAPHTNLIPEDYLTDTEYKVLLELYHEFNTAYLYLPDYIKRAFRLRLFGGGNQP